MVIHASFLLLFAIGSMAQTGRDEHTYIVTSIEAEPFTVIVDKATGEQRGFCVDLMERLASISGLRLRMSMVADNQFGRLDPTNKRWNGMIGELTRNDADLAIAPISITEERMEAVDFTHPFMTSGMSIMMKRPPPLTRLYDEVDAIHGLRTVLSVFHVADTYTYMCFGAALLATIVALFIITRLSPVDNNGGNNHLMSLLDCCYFIVGMWFHQHPGSNQPRSLSARVLVIAWWAFSLITLCVFVVQWMENAARFTRMHGIVGSLEEMAARSDVTVGVVNGGTSMNWLQHAEGRDGVYARLWNRMVDTRDESFVNTYDQGIANVRASNGSYGFLMEASANDYMNSRQPCDTYRVPGELLSTIHYGIAMRRSAPFKHKIDTALERLRASGELARMRRKWWNDLAQCDDVNAKLDSGEYARQASIFGFPHNWFVHSITALLFILAIAIWVSLILALTEFLVCGCISAKANKRGLCYSYGRQLRRTLCGAASATYSPNDSYTCHQVSTQRTVTNHRAPSHDSERMPMMM